MPVISLLVCEGGKKGRLNGENYGNGYIEWALSNFGGYSKYNAQLFSDNKKQEMHVSGYGDPLYVDHVMRYV